MFNTKRKFHDEYDTNQLWNQFEAEKSIHYNIPTISEMKELYKLLKSDKKELYTIDFEECEKKRKYWETVYKIYKKNSFIMPYTFRLGKELKFEEIWDYHITSDEIKMVEEIIGILKEYEDDYFVKEHMSFS